MRRTVFIGILFCRMQSTSNTSGGIVVFGTDVTKLAVNCDLRVEGNVRDADAMVAQTCSAGGAVEEFRWFRFDV